MYIFIHTTMTSWKSNVSTHNSATSIQKQAAICSLSWTRDFGIRLGWSFMIQVLPGSPAKTTVQSDTILLPQLHLKQLFFPVGFLIKWQGYTTWTPLRKSSMWLYLVFGPSIIFYIPIITSTPLVSINSSSLNCYDAQQPEPFTTALVSFLSSLVPQSYKLSSVEVCIYELISLIKEKVIAN